MPALVVAEDVLDAIPLWRRPLVVLGISKTSLLAPGPLAYAEGASGAQIPGVVPEDVPFSRLQSLPLSPTVCVVDGVDGADAPRSVYQDNRSGDRADSGDEGGDDHDAHAGVYALPDSPASGPAKVSECTGV